MKQLLWRFLRLQQTGLILVILLLGALLTWRAGATFFNPNTIMQWMTDSVFFAIMAVGITLVIISGGIDLSVGAIYAISGVMTAMALSALGPMGTIPTLLIAIVLSLGIGTTCGLLNGLMVVGLRVHPFIITLGTMWIFRGIAFVSSGANSILMPDKVISVVKIPLDLTPVISSAYSVAKSLSMPHGFIELIETWLGSGSIVYPVPMLVMLVVVLVGEVCLLKTVAGRNIYAVGGNAEAARYCGLQLNWTLVSVYVISGLTAGIAALVGSAYYGSACCNDGNGYELYVIAAAVVGGASLMGGKGSALSAMLGALLIVLIRQSIRTLHLPQNYEWIIIGCAIIIAVVLDRLSAQMAAKRMLSRSAEKMEVAAKP